jgi:hypothetical protein
VLIALVAGCQSQMETFDSHPCPFSDDEGSVEFTADNVIAAASVETTGVATSDELTDTWPVVLAHTFRVAGEPSVIVFDEASDPLCPSGRALLVPAEYDLSGTIGGWAVHDSTAGFWLVATAPELDAISTWWGEDPPTGVFWDDEVAQELEELAVAAYPDRVSSTCDLGFSLTPIPDNLLAGAWAEEVTDGGLGVTCDGFYGMFLDWVGEVTPETSTPGG